MNTHTHTHFYYCTARTGCVVPDRRGEPASQLAREAETGDSTGSAATSLNPPSHDPLSAGGGTLICGPARPTRDRERDSCSE
jgi:hypothetical protein